MTDSEILAEIKKGIDLQLEGTYTVDNLYSHIIALIVESQKPLLFHKNQMERLLYKVDELRETQRLYHGGDKSKIGLCKKLEVEMDKKVHNLLVMGYTIDRFKNKVTQQALL